MPRSPSRPALAAATALVMAAFAANSVLMRLALRGATSAASSVAFAEAAGVTLLRLGAGAVVLVALWAARRGRADAPAARLRPDIWAGLHLFVYAAAFSAAYLELSTGTGALVLFGAVQLTMIGAGLRAGERLGTAQGVGLAAAVAGLVVLVAPGVEAPPPLAAATMALSGVAWGLYSVRGRGAADPVGATTANFVVATGFAAALGAVALAGAGWPGAMPDLGSAAYAVVSGAVTSALGYVAWYAVLPHLPTVSASVVQLSVPVLAALGGLAFVAESVTLRLAVASALTLGGIAVVVRAPRPS